MMRFLDSDGVLVTVYTANESRRGVLWSLRQAYEDIISSRHVIFQLFWRDFISQFRQKLLGSFWAFLSPLIGIISFLFLFFIGVLHPGKGEISYPLYVLVGSAVWGCLPGAMGAVSGGLQSQADLIMRTRIPKLALAVSSLANLIYSIFVSMITISILFLITGLIPSWWLFAYPILVLPMVLLGTAIGLVLSVIGSIAKDIIPLATQVIALLMYFTPVIYLHQTIKNPVISSIIKWNPVTYLIDIPRTLICLGHTDNIKYYFGSIFGILILVVVTLRIFYLLEYLVAERL